MSANNHNLDDPVTPQQSIGRFQEPPERQSSLFDFFSDFLTGFGALFLLGVVLFIIVPVLLFILKVGLALIVPVAVLGACMMLIALFGRLIKSLIRKEPNR
jgi:ABC-type bacteriocin/lantibiotic exporter with double-glycine peptidase domain